MAVGRSEGLAEQVTLKQTYRLGRAGVRGCSDRGKKSSEYLLENLK